MSENMEVVIFSKSTIFDRKVRKPGDTVTVSEGEAENLRRIGVIDEKGTETETTNDSDNDKSVFDVNHESDNDNNEIENTSNVAPAVPEGPVTMPPPALKTMSYDDMSRKELMAELKKNNITLKGNQSKSTMIAKLTEHKSGE